MRRLAASAALALSAAFPAMAEMPEGITHFTLPNGLETVVIEDHRAPVIVQMLWYKIGSADEPPGKSGIAHYLEHLMFKGTDKLKPGELSQTVTRNGGMDNAFTSYDYTTYFQRIASDRLPLIMEMEADRMANLNIGEDDWQAERQVVLEERAQRTDSDPRALFGEERSAVQFYNHPYGRPVIGWRSEMMELTRDDAIEWYDEYYSPDRAVLILAGDVTPERARELAEEYYGPIEPKGDVEPRVRPQEPEQGSVRRMEMVDDRVAQPVMIRTIIAPERNAGDQKRAAALTVLAELLGGNVQTSVLGRELAQTGKALWVGAHYDGLAVDPTTFTFSMSLPNGADREAAEAEFDTVLQNFLETGPDAAALERIKTGIRAARIYAQDSAHGRAYDYGQGLATGLTIEDVNDWPDILAEVTEDDVMEAARELLESKATVTGWLLPPPATSAEAATEAEAEAAPTAATVPGTEAGDMATPPAGTEQPETE